MLAIQTSLPLEPIIHLPTSDHDRITLPLGHRVMVDHDDSPESPREWSNLSTMACWHRRHDLGDVQPSDNPADWLREQGDVRVIFALWLYDHSGLTIRGTELDASNPFSAFDSGGWDSGRVGYAIVSAVTIRKEYSCKRITAAILDKVRACVAAEIAVYDTYLQGGVLRYTIEDAAGNHVDSLSGVYPGDTDEETAAHMADMAGSEYLAALTAAAGEPGTWFDIDGDEVAEDDN